MFWILKGIEYLIVCFGIHLFKIETIQGSEIHVAEFQLGLPHLVKFWSQKLDPNKSEQENV